MTLDFDGTGLISKYKLVVAWLVLKFLSRNAVYGRKSATNGWHCKCHFLRISFKTSLLIRFLLLEDIHRTLFDMQRLKKPKQIAWTHKNKKPASKWCQNLLEVIR